MPDRNNNQDNTIVQAPAFDFSKYTTWATGIGTIGAAVVALLKTFSPQQNPVVTVGALAVVAAGLLAIAFVTAVDVYSRAYVTAAHLKAKATSSDPTPEEDPATKANGTSTLTAVVMPFSIQLHGRGPEPFIVLAIRWDASTKVTTYLVTRLHEQPMWAKGDDVEATRSLPWEC